jgi:hypothetical protein
MCITEDYSSRQRVLEVIGDWGGVTGGVMPRCVALSTKLLISIEISMETARRDAVIGQISS